MLLRTGMLFALLLLAALSWAESGVQTILAVPWGKTPGKFGRALDNEDGLGPPGFTLDAAGNIYVVDSVNERIQQFDPAGKYVASFARPHGIIIDRVAVSFDLGEKAHPLRILYAVESTGYGFNHQARQVYRALDSKLAPITLPLPRIDIVRMVTDSHHRLFIETKADEDRLSSTWLLDGTLGYCGHREISDICLQPDADILVGITAKQSMDGQPGLERWTVALLNPTDMQYPAMKTVELPVPVLKEREGAAHLIGIDAAGNLYVRWERRDPATPHMTTLLLRYAPAGVQTGTLDLTALAAQNLHVPGENLVITPAGDALMSIGTDREYRIVRLTWSNR